MRRIAIAALVLAGVGCGPAPSPTATPVEAAGTAPPTTTPASDTVLGAFDCDRPQGPVATLVCGDAELARLDQRLAQRYAREAPDPAEADDRAAIHRGWARGRDDCLAAEAPRRCLSEAYGMRLVQLQLEALGDRVPAAVQYRCDDDSRSFSATFLDDMDPAAVVLTWGVDRRVLLRRPGDATGTRRYGIQGADLQVGDGHLVAELSGSRLRCEIAG